MLAAVLATGAAAALTWFPLQRPITAVPLLLAAGRAWRVAAERPDADAEEPSREGSSSGLAALAALVWLVAPELPALRGRAPHRLRDHGASGACSTASREPGDRGELLRVGRDRARLDARTFRAIPARG